MEKSCCIQKNCIKCCIETDMLLSNRDVERIRKIGFDPKSFVVEKDGWMYLKNHNGRCVFHNGTKCLIYKDRPDGCRLYPVIFDMDRKCAVLDDDCPYKDRFRMSDAIVKKLYDVVLEIQCQRNKRNNYRL